MFIVMDFIRHNNLIPHFQKSKHPWRILYKKEFSRANLELELHARLNSTLKYGNWNLLFYFTN